MAAGGDFCPLTGVRVRDPSRATTARVDALAIRPLLRLWLCPVLRFSPLADNPPVAIDCRCQPGLTRRGKYLTMHPPISKPSLARGFQKPIVRLCCGCLALSVLFLSV